MAETNDILQKQYDRLIAARNYHYDNLNKWLMSFYVIIGALFLALYTLHASNHLHRYMEMGVAFVGYVVSLCALLSEKGYAYWETNWIVLLQDIERKVVPEQDERVYSIMANKELNNNAKYPISGANISTTKVTLLITSIVTVLWGMIAIYLGFSLLGWLGECRLAKVGIGLPLSAGVSWLLMWGGSKWLESDLNNLDDLKYPKREKYMEKQETKKDASNDEKKLKIAFWVLFGIMIVMLVVFICQIGIHTTFSPHSTDFANFSTYIGALGSMLFTGMYAYAFIKLQGAMNKRTQVEEESNNISKQKDENREIKKNLTILILSVDSSINSCLENVKHITGKTVSSEKRQAIASLLEQGDNNVSVLEMYYQQKPIFMESHIDENFRNAISNIKNNIKKCNSKVQKWDGASANKELKGYTTDLLTQSSNAVTQLKMTILSNLLS